jgi:hypothetical protein
LFERDAVVAPSDALHDGRREALTA